MLIIKPEKFKRQTSKKEDDAYERLYLIHHMHHFQKKGGIIHDLHHCFLYSAKNQKGIRFSVVHRDIKGDLYHCLTKKFTGSLYDHKNNEFKIIEMLFNQRKYFIIK
jgi:hypothetical protein